MVFFNILVKNNYINMQTLVFNTSDKTVSLYSDETLSRIIDNFSFDEVVTVAVREQSYYEVMKKSTRSTIPVARLPIFNTNMIIEN